MPRMLLAARTAKTGGNPEAALSIGAAGSPTLHADGLEGAVLAEAATGVTAAEAINVADFEGGEAGLMDRFRGTVCSFVKVGALIELMEGGGEGKLRWRLSDA